MRYVIALLLAISVIVAEARADSLVHNLTTSTTSPIPANSCIYVDQGPGTDTKLCANWVPTLLGGAALPVANGGTNVTSASGTALDNITGFSGTGVVNRTGAGTYAFIPVGATGNSTIVQTNSSGLIANSLISGLPVANLGGAINGDVIYGSGGVWTVTSLATLLSTATPGFNTLTSGTNTGAAMVVGTGASLAASGTGTITATAMPAAGLTGAALPAGITSSSLTSVGTLGTGTWQGTIVGVTYGGTGANLSTTGGASQVLQQTTVGGNVTVGQLAASNLSNGTSGSGVIVLASSPSLTTPNLGAATASSLTDSGITAGQCVQSGTGGLLQGTGQACPTATPAFSAIAAGTNTNALVIGSGGSLGTSGTGTITATAMPAAGLTGTSLPAGITGSSLTSIGTLGSLTVGGGVTFSGLGAGAQTSCLGLTSGNVVVPSAGGCGTGGGGGITAVNGTTGQINTSTASGVVTISLPPTITQSETFSALAGTIFTSQLQSSPTSTIASAAGATLDDVNVTAQTTTVTGTTGITTAKGFNKVSIYQPTFSDSSAVTISNAATLYVDGAPLAGGSVSISNPYAIKVGSGNVSFPGTGNILGTITSGTWNGNQIGLAYGGTGANLSATGGTNQVLQQATVGGAVTVGTLAASNLSNGTTGSGAVVLATSPTLTTPNLGTPTTVVLTNATGLPPSGIGGAVNNDCLLGVSGAWAASALCDLTNLAATYTAAKSFTNNDLILLGATSGSTILQAPATGGGTIVLPATAGILLESAGSNTLGGSYNVTGTFQANGNTQTFPSSVATLAGVNVAQTWSAVQSFNSGNLVLNGSTSGTLTVKPAAVAGTNTLTLPAGSTDFSSTGGTSQVVKQTSAGGAFTVAQLAASDLSNNTTGSGAVVLATSPTLTTPNLGTPSALTLTNATGLPLAGLAGQVNNNCALGNGTNWIASPLCDLTNQTATISAVKTYTAAPVISSITNTGTLTLPTTTGTLLESAGNNTLGGTYNLTGTLAVTIGSDATGDTYYRNSSGNLARLGIGTNGTFYSVVSGVPSWVTAPTGGTTTITLGAGLANNSTGTYNPGTQTVTNSSTIYQQLIYKSVTASCATDSTCGSTNDGGYLLTPTAGSLTITLTANGVRQYGYDGSHAYTLSAPSNSIYGCGPTGGSVVVATQVQIIPDGTNYQCVPSAQMVGVTASWLPGQNLVIPSTNVGVGLYTAYSNKTILAIVCTPEKAVGAGSDTLDVYLAASGTALQSGTKLTSTSCNVNGTAATNSGALLSAPVALPAGSRIGIVATGADWASSAGSGSITIMVE